MAQPSPPRRRYNPWQGDKLGGAAAGLDFDEDGYQHMLCVVRCATHPTMAADVADSAATAQEPTISSAPVTLAPGASWAGSQTVALA